VYIGRQARRWKQGDSWQKHSRFRSSSVIHFFDLVFANAHYQPVHLPAFHFPHSNACRRCSALLLWGVAHRTQ
jgi:hypothetical protein